MRRLIAIVAAVLICFGSARAATWPSSPITLIVPYGPGGTSDNVARLAADILARALGQPVIVENKPGASGMIGTAFAARAKPDGYTLLLVNNATLVIQPLVSTNVPYDPRKDFTFIASLLDAQQFIGVSAKLGTPTLAALIDKLKANPGKYNYGSAGSGSFGNFCGEFFKLATNTDIEHVPYKGSSPALLDLIAGRIQAEFDPVVITQPKMAWTCWRSCRTGGSRARRTCRPPSNWATRNWCCRAGSGSVDRPTCRLRSRKSSPPSSPAAVKQPAITDRAIGWGLQVAPRSPADSAAMLADDLRRYADIKAKAHIDTVQ